MKIAYTTTFNTKDVTYWSGTPFYMSKALENQNDVQYIGSLERKLPRFFWIKRAWKRIVSGQRECSEFNIAVAQYYSQQADGALKNKSFDVIVSPLIHPICYLKSKAPIVLWTDGLYAGFLGFYPEFSRHSTRSIAEGNAITKECLSRCSLAIFSSDWAARTAIEVYGVNKDIVKVVPYGANIDNPPTRQEVDLFLKNRSRKTVNLLFMGKPWNRKGGDVVFRVVHALHALGQSVELHVVGCYPPDMKNMPDFIKCHGFISKNTPAGVQAINALLAQAHFLFVPSRAEAFGLVFCEANAFGVPCLTTHIGGIPTIVKDNINGMTFELDADASTYCDYIIDLMKHYDRYEAMAMRAFHEFETRLNWTVATREVCSLIEKMDHNKKGTT